ncbi:MAG: PASTA domain-containing protein [Bacteroidota bacterium]
MFKFITRQHFIVNLLLAIALLFLLVFSMLWALGIITRHGDYEKVPVVTGKNFSEAIKLLESKGFSAEVQDSLWKEDIDPLTVIRQSPEADEMVKKHRHIYLTINRSQPPLIDIPNMVGLSFRNAELYLKQLGLKLGDTTRKPDIAKDAVLEQLYNGKPISPATRLFQGSTISFVLGSGIGKDEFEVPELRGMTYGEARALLNSMGLNIAGVLPDRDVENQDKAFIYKQIPEKTLRLPDGFIQKNKIRAGQSMDVWLSTNKPVITDSTPPRITVPE